MTRSELILRLSERFPQLVQKDAELAVSEILGAIRDALVTGNRVEIRGFGSFGLKYRPSRVGRNPRTGESVVVPSKYVPHFKAGKELRMRIERVQSISVSLKRAAYARGDFDHGSDNLSARAAIPKAG